MKKVVFIQTGVTTTSFPGSSPSLPLELDSFLAPGDGKERTLGTRLGNNNLNGVNVYNLVTPDGIDKCNVPSVSFGNVVHVK